MASEFDAFLFANKHPFVFEQSYFNNEVWLPTYEEAVLLKGFNVNAATRRLQKAKPQTMGHPPS
jgi:hypothetical protein